jgi:mRNA interferase YafQ
MRTIEWTSQFKRDFKREKRGVHADILEDALGAIVQALADDFPLEEKQRDHKLSGQWGKCRCRPEAVFVEGPVLRDNSLTRGAGDRCREASRPAAACRTLLTADRPGGALLAAFLRITLSPSARRCETSP